VNEQQRIDAVFEYNESHRQVHTDKRPFWIRLLASIKLDVKLGKTLKKPIEAIIIKGKAEF
jgi:hypothetical protein